MHLPIKVKSPNNISKRQMGFNSAFKGLTYLLNVFYLLTYLLTYLVTYLLTYLLNLLAYLTYLFTLLT
jgi:hypothetical protein